MNQQVNGLASAQLSLQPRQVARLAQISLDEPYRNPAAGQLGLSAVGKRCVHIHAGDGETLRGEGLGLEAAGVAYTAQGVTVGDDLRTSNPRIYAAGDVAVKHQFTHMADAATRIVLQNALFPGPRKKLNSLTVPWTTYTDPEIAHVGQYAHELDAAGVAYDVFHKSLAEVDRARTDGETEGFVKVWVKRRTDQILGATIVARDAGDMLNEITLAMVAGLGLKTLSTVIHPYPTQAEAIKRIADGYNRTRLTPTVKRLFTAWLAWARR